MKLYWSIWVPLTRRYLGKYPGYHIWLDETADNVLLSAETWTITVVMQLPDKSKSDTLHNVYVYLQCYVWRPVPGLNPSAARTNVQFWTETKSGSDSNCESLVIPLKVRRRIRAVLKRIEDNSFTPKMRNQSECDCMGFVCYLIGAPKYLKEIKHVRDARYGDIMIARSKVNGWHVAMFLSSRHVIHKLGGGDGSILITDFASALTPYEIQHDEYVLCRPVDIIDMPGDGVIDLDKSEFCGRLEGNSPTQFNAQWNRNHHFHARFTQ